MKGPRLSPGRVFVSFVLGTTGLLVFFVAGSAFETPGENSIREIAAALAIGTPYLAFCQFWVATKGVRPLSANWPTVTAMIVPFLALLAVMDRGAIVGTGIPFLAFGLLGSLAGAAIAGRVGARPGSETPPADVLGRLRTCRRCLLAGVALLLAASLLVAVGVIPPLSADLAYATGFRAHGVAWTLGATAAFNLLIAGALAYVALSPRAADRFSRAFFAIPAVSALLLTLLFAFASGIRSQNPALWTASVVLLVCAVCDLAATALVTAASLMADRIGGRSRLEPHPST